MKRCTCGKVCFTGAIVEVAVEGTYHRLDGPCYFEDLSLPMDGFDENGAKLVVPPVKEGHSARLFREGSKPIGPKLRQALDERSEMELREGILGEQQPEPTPTDEPSAHDLVIADMAARKEFGLAKYGSLLQASNGRDNLQDAYEEVLDLAVYLRNEIERRKSAEDLEAEVKALADQLSNFAIYDSDGSRDDIILAKHLVRRGVRVTGKKIP